MIRSAHRTGVEEDVNEQREHQPIDWKHTGVRVIPGDGLDPNTAQTPGMDRAAAIDLGRVGARKIWAGTVQIHPNANPAPITMGASRA